MKYLNEALSDYINDYMNKYIEQNNLDPDNIDNYYKDKEFYDMLQEHLENSGFSKEEASGICVNQLTKETAYKFMAYFIDLYKEYETIQGLKNAISDNLFWDVDEFTKEDLNEILKAHQKLT